MSYIISYGVSIPKYQIGGTVLDPAKGRRKGKSAVSFSDEDIITMSFETGMKCLEDLDKKSVDAVIFATSTPVFHNRFHASFVAGLLGLQDGIFTFDLTASPRSGTDAMILADNLISAGKYRNVLILASDANFPEIGDEMRPFGHAAAALLISETKGLAEITFNDSFGNAIAEEFIYKGNDIRLDARFGREAGFKSNMKIALKSVLNDNGKNNNKIKAEDFNCVILNSPYAKLAMGIMKKSGFDLEKQMCRDSFSAETGFTGSPHAILHLIECLENNSGNILLMDYWNGVNVVSIKQLEKSLASSSLKNYCDNFLQVQTYQDYLKLRKACLGEFSAIETKDIYSSEMMLEREKGNLLHLIGFECKGCGTIYYIKENRCKKCHSDNFEPKQLSRTGTVFSITFEFYFPTTFPPVGMAIIDLDGGGRMTLQVTDEMYHTNENMLKIGDRVELVLRKMMENDPKPVYFWKSRKI